MTPTRSTQLARLCPWLASLAVLIAVARCWTNVGLYNHTTDELAHIAGAVGIYETGRNLYMVEHPPLQRLVVGAALKGAGVGYPPAREADGVRPRPEANEVGEAIVFRNGKLDYWETLAVARRANLAFLVVLLAFVYVLGRYLAGPVAGLIACGFLSVDPTVLGHAGLVTTDVPAAAGFVMATYFALRFVARPTWARATLAGVALGLAVACKFTCGLLAPAILVLIGVRAVVRRRRGARTGRMPVVRWVGRFAVIAVVSAATLWATYLFNVGRLDDQHLFEEERGWQKIPQRVKEATLPMPSMPLGVMFMAAIGKTGFPCYFNGQLDFDGHLLYFPEAILIKSPVALGVALALSLVVCLFAKRRRPILTLCVILPPSLLLLAAMTGKLQIGIRHVLPVLPFVYLFAVVHLARRRWDAGALAALALLAGVETARVNGEWLPFFNVAVGGPANGSKYLADSNLDWGQDVARLAGFLKRVKATDYTIKVSGVRVAALVQHLGLDPKSRDVDPEELKKRPHGLLALGVNQKLGLEDFKREKDGSIRRGHDYSWVKAYPVVMRIGYSIEVYDLNATPAK